MQTSNLEKDIFLPDFYTNFKSTNFKYSSKWEEY